MEVPEASAEMTDQNWEMSCVFCTPVWAVAKQPVGVVTKGDRCVRGHSPGVPETIGAGAWV
jgi:hypothetical protein